MKYSRKSYAIIRATDSICLRRNFVIYDADYSPDVEFLSSDPKPTNPWEHQALQAAY